MWVFTKLAHGISLIPRPKPEVQGRYLGPVVSVMTAVRSQYDFCSDLRTYRYKRESSMTKPDNIFELTKPDNIWRPLCVWDAPHLSHIVIFYRNSFLLYQSPDYKIQTGWIKCEDQRHCALLNPTPHRTCILPSIMVTNHSRSISHKGLNHTSGPTTQIPNGSLPVMFQL